MVVGKTIFGSNGQILLKQGVELTQRYINHLQEHFIEVVYITTGSDVSADDVISDQTRIKALRETKRILSAVKRGAEVEIEQVRQALIGIIDELLLHDDVMVNLVDIRSHNEELFHHSLNVSILSVIVGIELQFSQNRLKDLAVAALLHDMGKVLDEDEKQHLVVGRRILRENKRVGRRILDAISQHHERWDGQGFPEGLAGEDICREARILQVTNVFDLMSANSRYPVEEVIQFLMAGSGTAFEPAAVRAFLNCVSFYPVGTPVELNTGESGIVTRANRGFPTRPVVRVTSNAFGPIEHSYELDLTVHPTHFVLKTLESEDWDE
jgi:putative nucleotidyltransferase with HDIG domain